MIEINRLYLNLYPNALKTIIDGLYIQVTDLVEFKKENPEDFKKTFDKDDIDNHNFRFDCLVLALDIYNNYNHVQEEYKDMRNYVKTLSL
jgi:hypothetical protein